MVVKWKVQLAAWVRSEALMAETKVMLLMGLETVEVRLRVI